MNKLAPLLFVAVVITHYAYEPLAAFYPDPAQAARAIFYVVRGVEATILYAVVWCLTPRSAAVGLACAWGMLESSQTAVCRAALGIGSSVEVAAYRGLCDVVTGLPVYGLTALAALVVASFAQEKNHEGR